ncbi:MAG: hypothetical protein L6R41_005291 [Letrouitia leprolyta]|nr:MAG: hypothetical protein L6R41_005291 [Letrouitia leprolyta]
MSAISPASAASPPVLAPLTPSIVTKPLAPNLSALPSPSIFTHKEWVIPPRPKPGRKPAADTPPTKRKAQNRQAQRAFRERRAARVGELEEQMKKMEEEDAREQEDLRTQLRQLKADLQSHSQLLLSFRQRMEELESQISQERKLRMDAETKLGTLKNSQTYGTDAVSLPSRKPNHEKQLSIPNDVLSNPQALDPYQEVSVGCGRCSQDTRCECIEQAFDIDDIAANSSETPSKRPHSPSIDEDNKRLRQEANQESEDNEIDFTSRFTTKKPPNLTTSASSASLPTAGRNSDPCGFCQDGSPCICAEMALEAIKSESRPTAENVKPEPSKPPNPCINGPGTCAQCLSDANSTLFCKSLAATRPGYRPNQSFAPEMLVESTNDDLPPTPSSNTDFPTEEANAAEPAITGPTLTCADAYETLSRHPAFEQASQELSTWMPQLATVPGGRARTAFEVEAASVMGVLKFFDRRFGKNSQKRRASDLEVAES